MASIDDVALERLRRFLTLPFSTSLLEIEASKPMRMSGVIAEIANSGGTNFDIEFAPRFDRQLTLRCNFIPNLEAKKYAPEFFRLIREIEGRYFVDVVFEQHKKGIIGSLGRAVQMILYDNTLVMRPDSHRNLANLSYLLPLAKTQTQQRL